MAKVKRSIRDYLGTDGKVVDTIEQASGARFTLVEMNGETPEPVNHWDLQMGPVGKQATMFGCLGFHTKIGNVANTVLNDKDAPGSLQDASDGIDEFLSGLDATPPVWAERVGGAGVSRYDHDKMADAIAAVTGKPKDEYLGKMSWKVNDKTGAQVTLTGADGKYPKGTISYPAFAYRNPKVRQHYDAAANVSGVDAALL